MPSATNISFHLAWPGRLCSTSHLGRAVTKVTISIRVVLKRSAWSKGSNGGQNHHKRSVAFYHFMQFVAAITGPVICTLRPKGTSTHKISIGDPLSIVALPACHILRWLLVCLRRLRFIFTLHLPRLICCLTFAIKAACTLRLWQWCLSLFTVQWRGVGGRLSFNHWSNLSRWIRQPFCLLLPCWSYVHTSIVKLQ